MQQVANAKGLFVIKQYDQRFEVTQADTLFDLTVDSLKKYANSTRFFLKNDKHKLFQLSIYADSVQVQGRTARIEFDIYSKPYYVRFKDWNPTYSYLIQAIRQ